MSFQLRRGREVIIGKCLAFDGIKPIIKSEEPSILSPSEVTLSEWLVQLKL